MAKKKGKEKKGRTGFWKMFASKKAWHNRGPPQQRYYWRSILLMGHNLKRLFLHTTAGHNRGSPQQTNFNRPSAPPPLAPPPQRSDLRRGAPRPRLWPPARPARGPRARLPSQRRSGPTSPPRTLGFEWRAKPWARSVESSHNNGYPRLRRLASAAATACALTSSCTARLRWARRCAATRLWWAPSHEKAHPSPSHGWRRPNWGRAQKTAPLPGAAPPRATSSPGGARVRDRRPVERGLSRFPPTPRRLPRATGAPGSPARGVSRMAPLLVVLPERRSVSTTALGAPWASPALPAGSGEVPLKVRGEKKFFH